MSAQLTITITISEGKVTSFRGDLLSEQPPEKESIELGKKLNEQFHQLCLEHRRHPEKPFSKFRIFDRDIP